MMHVFTIQNNSGMANFVVGVREEGFIGLVHSPFGDYFFEVGKAERLWIRHGESAYMPWTGGFRRELWAKSGLQFLSDVCDYANSYVACDLLWLYVLSALTVRNVLQLPANTRRILSFGNGQDELVSLEDQLFLLDDGRPMEEYIEIVDEFKSTRTRSV